MSIRTLIIALSTYLPPGNISQADCYNTDLCAFVDTVNQHAALGDRLFVLHAYRYYLRPDLFACSSRVGDYNSLEPLARQGSSEFWMELYRRGYRFILFEKHLSESRFNFGDLPSLDTVPDWMNVKILFSSPSANQLIYQLDVVNPPVRPEVSCKKTSTGLWQVLSSIPPARSLLNTPLSRSVQPKSSEQ